VYNSTSPAHAAPGATFATAPALAVRTRSSYGITVGTAEQIAVSLEAQGWRREAQRHPSEHARLRDAAGGLVVLYRASVLVQGQAARGHAALAPLLAEGRAERW
jgi:hypothetical protein